MLQELNEQQKSAILGSFTQDVLVLAGAGAGKSKVVVTRVEYILKTRKVEPSTIMAITFTNKAAAELLSRIRRVTDRANEMWVGTYHSICIRLLRMFGSDIGLEDFTILDPYNSKKAAIEILTNMGVITSKTILNSYMSRMSHLKNRLVTPKRHREDKLSQYTNDYERKQDPEYEFIEFYSKFQKANLAHQTIDFDDIILYTIFLLRKSPAAAEFVRKNFSYIHVDETQDSNTSNIVLFKLLSKDCNLFIVADIDQSIYGWRGARPEYLVDNAKEYKLFKLEQNYRSTQTIVNASNSVIANNVNRIDKTCFSNNSIGDPIVLKKFRNDYDEADWIADEILRLKNTGISLNDMFILYRKNAQSRIFEQTFIKRGVPYNIIGALAFNDRKEIKDCLAFVRVAVNKKDKQSLRRALGELEGIGKKAQDDILNLFDIKGNSIDALRSYQGKTQKSRDSVAFLLNLLRLADTKPYGVVKTISEHFINKLRAEGSEQANDRIQNLEELIKVSLEKESAGLMLCDFVSQMDLLSKSDKEEKTDMVSMMTVHASKGLESSVVFGVGLNEGILPIENSLNNDEGMEEERRLMYVLMTRTKEKLYLTNFYSDSQKMFGDSRFLDEIPDKFKIEL